MSIAIITGASSGMGAEFARQLQIYFPSIDEIWLIARRKERLAETARKVSCKTTVIQADITNPIDLRAIKRRLQIKSPKVEMLINCAGFGIMGKFYELSYREQSDMVELNIKALMKMTYIVLPYMKRDSRIINLASSAAFLPQPRFAVYAASKSFVLSFSRALNEELKARKIAVTAVCPGPVKTEFFDIAEKYNTTLAIKKYFYVKPDMVVRGALLSSLMKKPQYTSTLAMKAFQILTKILPHSIFFTIMKIFTK